MIKISKKTTLGEFAAQVASALRTKGIDTVLTGGAVVSIYTNNRYESGDADFISLQDHETITKTLISLGFTREGRSFSHPDSDFFVEFPPGRLPVFDRGCGLTECGANDATPSHVYRAPIGVGDAPV